MICNTQNLYLMIRSLMISHFANTRDFLNTFAMNSITLTGGEHAVLLVHGLQSSPVEMQPLAKLLSKLLK